MSAYGFVYVLRHDLMPNVYKIGYTDRAPMTRRDELSASTSAPGPFELVCYGEVDGAQSLEAELHNNYRYSRVTGNREFFHMPIEDLQTLMDEIRFRCDMFSVGCLSFFESLEFEIREKMRHETIRHFLDQNADPIHWAEQPVVKVGFDNDAPF